MFYVEKKKNNKLGDNVLAASAYYRDSADEVWVCLRRLLRSTGSSFFFYLLGFFIISICSLITAPRT